MVSTKGLAGRAGTLQMELLQRIEDLETSQELEEAALTAYHLITILFELSTTAKTIFAHNAGGKSITERQG